MSSSFDSFERPYFMKPKWILQDSRATVARSWLMRKRAKEMRTRAQQMCVRNQDILESARRGMEAPRASRGAVR
ncbi:hypothetical protein GKJPGBOP_04508 [Streptomyces paromomycinus]|uniref:Uncharacterized protein n=1 Tax=Streptomyces paromomycinus TaxID=92743 RepID=A0A401W607_STREY|nr:hypothetical protein GKJPGBOP_04508 [Streptomyces paromomycinus]